MSLGLYGVEHWSRHNILALGWRHGMGIYSGVKHTVGVGYIEFGLEFLVSQPSFFQYETLRWAAVVVINPCCHTNVKALACALTRHAAPLSKPRMIYEYNVQDATARDLRQLFLKHIGERPRFKYIGSCSSEGSVNLVQGVVEWRRRIPILDPTSKRGKRALSMHQTSCLSL